MDSFGESEKKITINTHTDFKMRSCSVDERIYKEKIFKVNL